MNEKKFRKVLENLNPRQREAAMFGEGPLLILAGAGSGKTSTMCARIAYLIGEKKVPGKNILALSFTNKAAKELKERALGLLRTENTKSSPRVTVSTFHSLGVRVLRKYAPSLGLTPEFTIFDASDQESLLKQILRTIKIDDRKFDVPFLLQEFSRVRLKGFSLDEAIGYWESTNFLKEDYGIACISSYPKYFEAIRTYNAVDFEDLLYLPLQLMREHPGVREELQKTYRYILVDEYQDTNPTQFKILEHLTEKTQNICVVGDDDQSIYGFRGADSTHILEFKKHYPHASVITLDQNYRSTKTILDAANSLISKNKKRHPKTLWSSLGDGERLEVVVCEDDRDEADFVAENILSHQKQINSLYSDYAVLYRSNTQARVFEESFRKNQIPYVMVGGYSFLNRKEVKDVLAYFRACLNPKDETSLRRILNWPMRGISRNLQDQIQKHSIQNEVSFWDSIRIFFESLASEKQKPILRDFLALLQNLRNELEGIPADPGKMVTWIQSLYDQVQVKVGIEKDSEDELQALRKMEILEDLKQGVGQWKEEELSKFKSGKEMLREYLSRLIVEDQEKEEDEKEKEKKKNGVTLLTLHSSKGLEFPYVYFVGFEEGMIPHQRVLDGFEDISEERRLAYVGITRAKKKLVFTRAAHRIRYGKKVPKIDSRFMAEIPSEIIHRSNRSSVPDLNTEDQKKEHEVRVKSFLSEIRAKIIQKN